MLETKDLVKIYKPKKGVPVTALDHISLKFPEKGMVFLLGKSGSGKSTLLNVLGGLDRYDGGEITIMGVSSKNFKQRHFDSYRNTYVGFIFQEYNILDEFSVGANIALSIELQDRKAEDKEINKILKEVDLEGFGNRKPNELSGGQKQRVAIARALVKNPKIIMADEPTGALDSNTGRQVFDTLKKLSESKLVIVVSHDREFAEQYADRIIELSDGRVISDVELDNEYNEAVTDTLNFHGNTVDIPSGYHLTEEDREQINKYIDELNGKEMSLSVVGKSNAAKRFVNTDTSKIAALDSAKFKLIKSKLPLKSAFKIGASGLKYKKFRLVMTIILSCISFGLFGLADTFGSYNHAKTCANSLIDTGVEYTSVAKSKNIKSKTSSYWHSGNYKISEDDIKQISDGMGVKMRGVYMPTEAGLDFSEQTDPDVKLTETEYGIYTPCFSGGFSDITNDIIKEMNFKILCGELPNGEKDEIAISEYIYEVFKKAGYFDGVTLTTDAKGAQIPLYQKIEKPEDMIGKTITLDKTKFTVTAVVDTGFDVSRYEDLTKKKDHQSSAEKMVDYILYNEYCAASAYSYAGVVMTGDGYVKRMIENSPNMSAITEGFLSFYGNEANVDPNNLARLSDVSNEKIIWADGEKSQLGEKEIIITSDLINYDGEEAIADYNELLKKKPELSAWQYDYVDYEQVEGYKIVGIIDTSSQDSKSKLSSCVVAADSLYNEFCEGRDYVYSYAIGKMPSERSQIYDMVDYCYNNNPNVRFGIQNSVTFELDAINDVLKTVSKYFLYIGIGFAVFAALMLANFIATSISHKKQEIGILRAIGSRSNDVFRIFFSESFIIAAINFVLSSIGVFAATVIINSLLREKLGILVTVLNFGLRQILLVLAVSIIVAFIASYLPVKRIASKKPIDAIRDR